MRRGEGGRGGDEEEQEAGGGWRSRRRRRRGGGSIYNFNQLYSMWVILGCLSRLDVPHFSMRNGTERSTIKYSVPFST